MKRALKIAIVAIVVAAVIGTFFVLWKKSRPEITTYELVPATTQSIVKKTVATGKVDPRDEVKIVPQLSGIVSELLKEAGQKVKKGDIIARIKVIPDVSSLNNAENQVNNAELNLELATQDFERVKGLFENGVATKEEFQKSQNSYLAAQQALASATNALDIVKNGVTEKYASYSNTQIRSTISGTILSVPVKVGNSVIQANTFNEGTTIASVADMNDMLFIGNIDETEVGRIKEGMNLNVTIGAIKDVVFPATLEYISPKSTEDNGAILFEIKAAVKIPDGQFVRAGYSANAEIILEQAENVLTVPEGVIEFEGDSTFVYVFKGMDGKNQQFEKTAVSLGLSDGLNAEVKSGLDGSEQLRGEIVKNDKK